MCRSDGEQIKMRQMILTTAVFASIPTQVQQGFNAKAIAARLGCTVGTLRVRCSQAQITLRVAKVMPPVPAA